MVRLYDVHMEDPHPDMVSEASLSKDKQAEFAADQPLLLQDEFLEKGIHFGVCDRGKINFVAPTHVIDIHHCFVDVCWLLNLRNVAHDM